MRYTVLHSNLLLNTVCYVHSQNQRGVRYSTMHSDPVYIIVVLNTASYTMCQYVWSSEALLYRSLA